MKNLSGKITVPCKGERLGARFPISGYLHGDTSSFCFWIAHRREYSGVIWPKEPKIEVSKSKQFSIIGYEGGAPGKIVISLLAVSKEVSRDFEKWLKKGHKTGNYPGINVKKFPLVELDAVDVIYDNARPLKIFYSYSHDDEVLRKTLEKHLSVLKRQNLIESWHDRCISAGTELSTKIRAELDRADIVLLLVSSSFLASDYCYNQEMRRALERHRKGEARVVPIIVRAVDWKGVPFSDLLALPTDGKPVKSWQNEDEAWVDVAMGLRKVIYEMR